MSEFTPQRVGLLLANCVQAPDTDESERCEMLREVFNASLLLWDDEAQAQALDAALGELERRIDEPSAQGAWLLEQLEDIASNRSVLQPGLELKSAVLFAIPVVLEAGEPLPVRLLDDEIAGLARVLEDHDVVSSAVAVKLAPFLMSADDMLRLSLGQVGSVCEKWGANVEESPTRWLEPPNAASPSGAGAELRFVLGIALAEHCDVEDMFPYLDEEPNAPSPDGLPANPLGPGAGFSDAGESWTQAFCQQLEVASGHTLQVLDAVEPNGLFIDIVTGLERWREAVLMLGTQRALDAHGLDTGDVEYEIQPPLADAAGLFLVRLRQPEGGESVLAVEWSALPDEPVEFACRALEDALESLGVAPVVKTCNVGLTATH